MTDMTTCINILCLVTFRIGCSASAVTKDGFIEFGKEEEGVLS